MGRFSVAADLRLQQQEVLDGEVKKTFTGKVNITGKGDSSFILTTMQSSKFTRILVKLQNGKDALFEDVMHNTSVRFLKIPFSKKRCTRSNKDEEKLSIIHIDQFHVTREFQRKGCGTKVMGVIFLWIKVCYPIISKCIVKSPSSNGASFYLAVGASRQASSRNLEWVMSSLN
jgi:hypothetical protein